MAFIFYYKKKKDFWKKKKILKTKEWEITIGEQEVVKHLKDFKQLSASLHRRYCHLPF